MRHFDGADQLVEAEFGGVDCGSAGIAAVVQLQIVLACQDVCAGYSVGWRRICLRHVLWQECGTVGVYL